MGSFIGHAIPGAFFVAFGVFWTFQIALFRAKHFKKQEVPQVRTLFPCGCGNKYPLEAYFRIFFTVTGMVIEFASSLKHPEFWDAADMQHVTMYAGFTLVGIVEVLTFYHKLVPFGTDYFIGFMAFIIEATLFIVHIEHQNDFEKLVHQFLIVAIFGCAIAVVLESLRPNCLQTKYVRAFFVTLQGAWFIQVGFLIYNPMSESHQEWHTSRQNMDSMWVSVMFCWFCMVILLVMGVLSSLIWFCQRGYNFSVQEEYSNDVEKSFSTGYSLLKMTDDPAE